MKSLFRTKSIESTIDSTKSKNSLKRTLTAFDLVLLGVGGAIGTGIFVLTGIVAAKHAGPGVSLSYLLAGVICIFTALVYSELAAMVPVSGSSYTYSYITMGEFIAWLIAWCLILEYTVCSATVAAGWSGYFVGILNASGIHIPDYLTKVPVDGGLINLPAVCISLFVGLCLVRGTKESVIINRILVAVKVCAIFLFLLVAVPHIKMENYANFMPFGWHGVAVGAGTIFFAYVGFDAIATTVEETKNPNRDVPIGIIGSLLVCTLLYVLVSIVLTGITHYSELNNPEPVAYALRQNGSNIGSALVGTGAIVGMVAVLLVMMYGQSRIFFVMSRDGLISPAFNKLHSKFNTPYISCMVVMVAVMAISGFTPIATMGHLTSLGTLFAFIVVSFGVLILRIKKPDLKRPFKCPAIFIVAPTAILSCGYLVYNLLLEAGKPFIVWIILGLLVYFSYVFKRSPLNK